MKTQSPRALQRFVSVAIAALVVTACKEDQTAEIKKLNEELEMVRGDFESQRNLAEDRKQEIEDTYKEVAELKSELRSTERELRNATSELERYRRKEEAARTAEAEKPDSRELRAAAKETVSGLGDSLVSIAGDAAKGRGVLVEVGGKTWIYCGTDALAKNTKLEIRTGDGTILKDFGAFEVAGSVPLARLEVRGDEVKGVPLSEEAATLERSATLLAFDDSAAVAEGRLYGDPMPEALKVDSRIGSCPVGTPVFQGESARLVGLIAADTAEAPGLWPDLYERRGGPATKVIRLDRNLAWSPVPIGTFLEESRLLEETDRLTRLMHAFAATTATAGGLGYGSVGGGTMAADVLDENKQLAVVKELRDLDSWLRENSGRSAQTDINKKVVSVYGQMERMAQRQTQEVADRRFSPAHASAAARSLEWRREAAQNLRKRIAAIE